jgi:hypothetical protein
MQPLLDYGYDGILVTNRPAGSSPAMLYTNYSILLINGENKGED